jgi:outer membrane protein assembly factor BamB
MLLNKNILAIGTVFLFIVSSITPMVIGYRVETNETDLNKMLDDLRFVCSDANGFSKEKYVYYKEKFLRGYSSDNSNDDMIVEVEKVELAIPIDSLSSPGSGNGPMDSPWPMQSHDAHHTGQSPYSTANVDGLEKWRFGADDRVEGGVVIDNDGIIYFGDFDRYLYAVYPDGMLKWKYKLGGWIWSTPAIAEDGTIYVGVDDSSCLYAIYPNGTEKWSFNARDTIYSSPAIAEDGTIYFGTMGVGYNIYAVNPNGTEKWHYKTGYKIVSDPAISDDGTVYIGSGDSYLYAMYPNGTLRWRFKTGDEIHGHPAIGEDGTIYIGSYDDYFYAIYPNGTMRWRFHSAWGAANSAAIADNGTIYVGTDKLYARNPDGSHKWTFNLGANRRIGFSSPAISADGTIYVGVEIGNRAGGEIIAVNSDGTERWRKNIGNRWVDSSPCIGEDGTVYVGSSDWGYLHAFGPVESNEPPGTPTISGETNGWAGRSYWYTFKSIDPDRNPISFYIDWGDGEEGWTSERASGENCYYEHAWSERDEYTIRCKAKDVMGEESDWGELVVTMPRKRALTNLLLYRLLEQFPILQKILDFIL